LTTKMETSLWWAAGSTVLLSRSSACFICRIEQCSSLLGVVPCDLSRAPAGQSWRGAGCHLSSAPLPGLGPWPQFFFAFFPVMEEAPG
jgi:hypothetical protein